MRARRVRRRDPAACGKGHTMQNYKLTLSYDGTRYSGWQRQGNTGNTIQAKLEAGRQYRFTTALGTAAFGVAQGAAARDLAPDGTPAGSALFGGLYALAA